MSVLHKAYLQQEGIQNNHVAPSDRRPPGTESGRYNLGVNKRNKAVMVMQKEGPAR
jgi:hypothetical protein